MTVPAPFVARFIQEKTLAPGVRELTFEREDGAPFVFEAGQWVNLVLPLAAEPIKRSYSIASAPDGSPRFALAVTLVEGGPGSSYLHRMQLGATLEVHGPSGFFVRRNDEPALFVGTGTGLTPLRSMLLDAARSEGRASAPMRLLAGFRYEHDRLYQDELSALAATLPDFAADCTLSRASDAWQGKRGYVQAHLRPLYEQLCERAGRPAHVYICGLQRMVAEVRDLLRKQMQLPRELVHSERYD